MQQLENRYSRIPFELNSQAIAQRTVERAFEIAELTLHAEYDRLEPLTVLVYAVCWVGHVHGVLWIERRQSAAGD